MPLSNPTAIREVLLANCTYYVRTDGSDANTGLADTAGGAFLTIGKAIDTLCALDLSIYQATIQVRDGTYTPSVVLKNYVGALAPIIQGNSGTPANVLISVTSASGIENSSGRKWVIRDLKIQTTTSGNSLHASGGGSDIDFTNLDFGACAGAQVYATVYAKIKATGNYAVSGGTSVGGAHVNPDFGGIVDIGLRTITFSNSPSITTFAKARGAGSNLIAFSNTFTNGGTVTATRYTSDFGYIFTNGGGASYFPGGSAGSVSNGGVYV